MNHAEMMGLYYDARAAWETARDEVCLGYATEEAEYLLDHPRPRLADFMRLRAAALAEARDWIAWTDELEAGTATGLPGVSVMAADTQTPAIGGVVRIHPPTHQHNPVERPVVRDDRRHLLPHPQMNHTPGITGQDTLTEPFRVRLAVAALTERRAFTAGRVERALAVDRRWVRATWGGARLLRPGHQRTRTAA